MTTAQKSPTATPPIERLWDSDDVAAYLNLHPRYVRERLRYRADFPAPVHIGRMLRWQPREIKRWAGE